MAGKPIDMSKIKQVLQLHKLHYSNRSIAKTLGLYKGTVNEYIRKVKSSNFDIDSLLAMEDLELEKKFFAGNPAYMDERFEYFKNRLPHIINELENPHVTMYLLWQEYKADQPTGYCYSQFCYHLDQQSIASKPSGVLTHLPGNKLQIDFAGKTLHYVDIETGEMIEVQVFVACLPFSSYTFVMAVQDQSIESFLYALSSCLQAFGGCPQILVPDNLKAAVDQACKYEPKLNKVMEDFANHYGIAVVPARVRKPKDKALVESHVNIAYNRIYGKIRHYTFHSIEDLNKAIFEKTKALNQTRMQQKPYSREEQFIAQEKPMLKPLPEHPFEIKHYVDVHVGQNNHVYLGRYKNYYSVPYTYVREKVQVIYTRTLVRIYHKGVCIATHPRSYKQDYTTVDEHLASNHKYYKNRNPEYFIKQAYKYSMASAFGVQACKQGYTVAYYNTQKLCLKLKTARLENTIIRLFEKLAKTDLIIFDDFGLSPIEKQQQLDFMEIIEDRHAKKATMIVSQIPVQDWFDVFSNKNVADAILDRIVYTSHRFELKGDSLRKKR